MTGGGGVCPGGRASPLGSGRGTSGGIDDIPSGVGGKATAGMVTDGVSCLAGVDAIGSLL